MDILPVVVGLVARLVYPEVQFWSDPGAQPVGDIQSSSSAMQAHLYLPSSAASTRAAREAGAREL